MANFEISFASALLHEKGYQNNKDDKGNYNSSRQLIGTNMGISAPILETYLKKVPTVSDMKNLTVETAKNIYLLYFWNFYKLNQINSQIIANLCFNIFIMSSPKEAGKTIQRGISELVDIVIDGSVGPKTIKAINDLTSIGKESVLNNSIISFWKNYLLSLNNETFVKGWMNRVESFILDIPTKVKKSPITSVITVIALSAVVFGASKLKG